MEVSEYESIKLFLRQNKYPKAIKSKTKKRNFRRKCQDFLVVNGTLHYRGKFKRTLRVLKVTDVDYVLEKIHTDEPGGHLGINKT